MTYTHIPMSIFMNNFNSHAHVERDENDRSPFELLNNFNSHAHVERDQRLTIGVEYNAISTHTLTWSVTNIDVLELN